MTQTMITLQQIADANPCTDGWRTVLKANGGTKADYAKPFPLSSILDSNDLEDAIWTLRCLPDDSQLWRRFAWWCASSVVHLATNEDAQYNIDVIDLYINGAATTAELSDANSAVSDASYAARAARAASSDARAASDASYAASYAARAASYAARAASSDARAASSAAQIKTLRQLLDHGIYPSIYKTMNAKRPHLSQRLN